MPDVYTIAAGADDAHQYTGGSTVVDSSHLEFPASGAESIIGLRFASVAKPAGGTLISAKLYVWSQDQGVQRNFTSTLYPEDAAASVDFATADVWPRDLIVGQAVNWNDYAASNAEIDSPDLTVMVNAMMAVSGWASGSPLTFLWQGHVSDEVAYGYGATSATFASYEHGPSYAARLELEWSVPLTIEHPPRAVVIGAPPSVVDMTLFVEVNAAAVVAGSVPTEVEASAAVESRGAVVIAAPPGDAAFVLIVESSPAAVEIASAPSIAEVTAAIQSPSAAAEIGSGPSSESVGATTTPAPRSVALGLPPETVAIALDLAADVVALEVSVTPAVVSPGVRISPVPAGEVLGSGPSVAAVETIGLPGPGGLLVGRPVSGIVGGAVVAADVVAATVSNPPAVVSPGVRISPVPAAEVLGSGPSVVAVETIGLSPAGAMSIGRSVSAILGGVDVAADVVELEVGGPSAVVSSAVSVAVDAADVIISPIGSGATIVAVAVSTPQGVVIGRPASSPASGVDVATSPVAATAGVLPLAITPGSRISPVPAGEVLGSGPSVETVETVNLSGPAAVVIARVDSVMGRGVSVAASPAAATVGTSPAVVSPGSRVAAVPAGEVLGSGPNDVAVETIARSQPGGLLVGRSTSTLLVGVEIETNPIAATGAAIVATVLPGTSVVHDPAAAALASPATAVAVETIAKPSPGGLLVGRPASIAGLGHIITPAAVPLSIAAAERLVGGPSVASTPAAASISSMPVVGVVGATALPSPVAIALGAALSSIDISGAIQSPPAAVAMGSPAATLVGGVVLEQLSRGVVIHVLPPHGIGAVHIAGPDLFYTLPTDRLHYTLYAERLHFTLGADMSTAKQLYTKAAAETKDVVIDCANALADDETITGTPTVEVSSPDDLTITGIAVNEIVLTEPGFPDAQIGQAIQLFVGGGTAGTTYELTVSYETSGGQSLEAVAKLRVT